MLLRKTTVSGLTNQKLSPRLDTLDILRGVALFGVFITHFICQFYGLAFPLFTEPPVITTPVDSYLEKLLRFLIFDKARGMFSFLFGVGFYLQLIKAAKTGISFKFVFIKRLAILLLLGLLHYFFLFKGDVLRYYAILGVILLFCYHLKPKIVLIAAILFTTIVPAICSVFDNDLFIGSFNTPMFIAIFGHFLFGLWVAKQNILQNLLQYRPQLKRAFFYSIGLTVGFFLIRSLFNLAAAKQLIVISPSLKNVLDITFMVGNEAMILAFLSGIPLLYLNQWWKSKLMVFIAPGRMTLTNYLAQSVIAIVFYKLGFYQLLGTAAAFLTSILVCCFQLYFSRWWLSYFTAGPVEWAWRQATNFSWNRQTKPAISETDRLQAEKQDPTAFSNLVNKRMMVKDS